MIRTSTLISPIEQPSDAILLNESAKSTNLYFELFVNDPEFDNDDNPYGQWIYHKFTNMDNISHTTKDEKPDGYRDEHIPLVPCN